tara:strand:+ start:641 stop:1252 length:612 start_codon:yes stop_codon:yes gene_type:complete
MKQLRQYIRQVLLTEAAKGAADIPDGYFIIMRTEGNEWARWEFVKGNPNYYEKAYHPDLVYGHMDIGKVHKDRYGNCLDAWMVRMSKAKDGFGPMLYDVAIEYATKMGSGLISDRGGSTPAAQAVWDHYYQNRVGSDIEMEQLDNEDDSFRNGLKDDCDQDTARATITGMYDTWEDSALSKIYKKSADTTIQELEGSGKLVRL